MVPKHQNKGEKSGLGGAKQGGFTCNFTFDAFFDLKLLTSLRNFKNICGGVLF